MSESKVVRCEISHKDTTHMLAQTSYKSRKFHPNGKKITIFTIWNSFLNVSNQDYIFIENVKRKKLFLIKFFLRTLFTVKQRPHKKPRNFSAKCPKKEVWCSFLQNDINVAICKKRIPKTSLILLHLHHLLYQLRGQKLHIIKFSTNSLVDAYLYLP